MARVCQDDGKGGAEPMTEVKKSGDCQKKGGHPLAKRVVRALFGTLRGRVLTIVSVGLAVGGFFCPPIGQIDGSVLTAIGIFLLWHAIDKGLDARVTHGETQIDIINNDEKDKKNS